MLLTRTFPKQFNTILDYSFAQSPRKVIAGPTVDGASPNKLRKLSMDQAKDNEAKKNGFSAIKPAPTMEFNPELEPLLRDNPKRFVIFPIQYKDIWDMYKKVMYFILLVFAISTESHHQQNAMVSNRNN